MKRMMKMMAVSIVLSGIFCTASVFALAGGAPELHGIPGKEFGEAVSTLAKSEPGAVAAHIADAKGPEMMEEAKTGGVPAAHGLTGKEFGKAVSTLAKSGPGMVAQHVSE